MSFYTSSIKTNLIDPVYDGKNKRTEFRLQKDKLYLPNFRLSNLGFTSIAASGNINKSGGIYSFIKNIYLYDGRTVLDQILGVNDYLTWKNYNSENSVNRDINKWLVKHKLGYDYFGIGEGTINEFLVQKQTAIDITDTPTAWLDLTEVFPFLRNSEYVPTSIYKNLSVVVEYTVDNLTLIPDGGTTPSTTLEPLLIVDEIMDPEFINNFLKTYKGVRYLAIEHDQQFIAGADASATVKLSNTNTSINQKVSFKINGFDNKVVNRMLVIKKPTINNTSFGTLHSQSFVDEKLQFRVNGRDLLPDDGIDKPNRRLAMLNDAFGLCNTVVGSNTVGFANYGNHVQDTNLASSFDYAGVVIGDSINDLLVNFSRTGRYDSSLPTANNSQDGNVYNQPFNMHFFGEVDKEVVVTGDKYQVMYN